MSEAVARAMATGCRDASHADFALSVTGIAGPGGGNPPEKPIGLVYVGLATGAGATVKKLLLGDHLLRCEIRDRACKSALNVLRLHLIESAAS